MGSALSSWAGRKPPRTNSPKPRRGSVLLQTGQVGTSVLSMDVVGLCRAQISQGFVLFSPLFGGCLRVGAGRKPSAAVRRGKCGEQPVIHRLQPGNKLGYRGKHRWKGPAVTETAAWKLVAC